QKDIWAVFLAVVTMAIVILLYDQLLFRPVVAWADKFRFEQTAAQSRPHSWVYDIVRRTRLIPRLIAPLAALGAKLTALPPAAHAAPRWSLPRPLAKAFDLLWLAVVVLATAYAAWLIIAYVRDTLGLADVLQAVWYGFLTLIRVVVLIAIASLIWVPVGVWIG